MKHLLLVVLLLTSNLVFAGPDVSRAIGVVDNTFGIDVTASNLRKIADSFAAFYPQMIPAGVSVEDLTDDQKAAIFLTAVQKYIRSTVVHVAREEARSAAEASLNSAVVKAERILQ
jgi:hypothetical protein